MQSRLGAGSYNDANYVRISVDVTYSMWPGNEKIKFISGSFNWTPLSTQATISQRGAIIGQWGIGWGHKNLQYSPTRNSLYITPQWGYINVISNTTYSYQGAKAWAKVGDNPRVDLQVFVPVR